MADGKKAWERPVLESIDMAETAVKTPGQGEDFTAQTGPACQAQPQNCS